MSDLPPPAPARRLLLVHAHPDDETINSGVTMARYAAEGAQVTLVTCTLGEEGEILVPELVQLGAAQADQLGGYRLGELAAAMAELGVLDHRILGGPGRFRDSGMMGTPANSHPRAFWQADVEQAADLLARVIREIRPQVLVTYDEFGGYGHPDHIQAHRVAMRAVELAESDGPAGPDEGPSIGWSVAKVYWCTMPRSVLQAGVEALRAAGADTGFLGADSVEDLPFARPDEVVTTSVEGSAHVPAKLAAMRAHATQIAVDGPFFALSNNLGLTALGTEYYTLVRGPRGPAPAGADPSGPGWEDDLFAGLAEAGAPIG